MLRVTLPTTKEEAVEAIAAMEARVKASAGALAATIAVYYWSPDRMADLVNDHAALVGQAKALADYADMVGSTGDAYAGTLQSAAARNLLRSLARKAGDTWSGRTNDARRAEADGYREMAGAIIDELS